VTIAGVTGGTIDQRIATTSAGVEVPIAIAQFPDVLRPARTPLLIATRTAAPGTDTRVCRLITGTAMGSTRVSKTRETTIGSIRCATVATGPEIEATIGATDPKRNTRACIARASVRDMRKPTATGASTMPTDDPAAVGGRGHSNLLGKSDGWQRESSSAGVYITGRTSWAVVRRSSHRTLRGPNRGLATI
jgi:hypothetical protein